MKNILKENEDSNIKKWITIHWCISILGGLIMIFISIDYYKHLLIFKNPTKMIFFSDTTMIIGIVFGSIMVIAGTYILSKQFYINFKKQSINKGNKKY